MENINHVNKFFYLRLFFIPLFLFLFLCKLPKIYWNAWNYSIKGKNIQPYTRYKLLFRCGKIYNLIKNVEFYFLNFEKVLKTKTIFIINSNFEWRDLALIEKLSGTITNFLITCFLRKNFLNKRGNLLLDLIDVSYYPKDAEIILSKQKSMLFEEKNIVSNPEYFSLLYKSMVNIVPIHIKKVRRYLVNSIYYSFGDPIKIGEFVHLEQQVLQEQIKNDLNLLERKLENYLANKRRFNLKNLFIIKLANKGIN